MTAFFLMLPSADDVLMLAIMSSALTIAACAGRLTGRTRTENNPAGTLQITSATLTLSGLLIGFVFSVSLGGYSAREQAELRETQSVGSAWQYSVFLPAGTQQKVQLLLKKYLDDRINFYREETTTGERGWSHMTEQNQRQLWKLVTSGAENAPSSVMVSVLSAFNALMISQHQTRATWKRQIPDAAWLVLMIFAASSCFLVGHQHHERYYLLVLPALTSLVLFMIAEIDIPGQGIIRVTPDDLEQLSDTLMISDYVKYNNLSVPVHHVP